MDTPKALVIHAVEFDQDDHLDDSQVEKKGSSSYDC